MLVVACTALAASVAAGGAASSSVVVSMNVSSSVSITNRCTDPSAYRFGTVQPGAPAITATGAAVCGIEFESSNDTTMLRASQADGAGVAMTGSTLAWQETNPGSGDINDISFAPGTDDGWAVGYDGLLLQTLDGGATWSPMACAPCGTLTLTAVVAVSPSSVFITASGRHVLRYDGAVWEALTQVPAAHNYIPRIDSTDGATVWIVGAGGMLLRTTNANGPAASVTWQEFQVGTQTYNDLDVIDPNTVFAVGNNGTAARTINGGSSWDLTTTLSGSVRSVAATSATSAVVVNSGGLAYTTSDGVAWSVPRETGVRELLQDVDRDGANVYAVSDMGRVVYSADSGTTWSVRHTRTHAALQAVGVIDADSLVTGGQGKSLQLSNDWGVGWAFVHSVEPNLADVTAVDAGEAFAVGDRGTIVHTTNAGATWTPQTSTTTELLRGVASTGVDGDRLIAVGDAGTVVHTNNAGATWSAGASGTTQRLRGVAMAGRHVAWAVGDNGTILKSTTGGASWSAQASGTTLRLNAVTAASDQVAWAAGGSGDGNGERIILGTTDGGATWTPQYTQSWGSEMTGISAVSATRAAAASLGGDAYLSVDGSTWTSTDLTWRRFFAIDMVSSEIGFISGYDIVYRTLDGGASWQSVTGISYESVFGIDALDQDTVIGVGDGSLAVTPTATGTISDYGAAPNSWGGASTSSLFGICLQDVGAGTSAVWTEDAAGVAGRCEVSDADPWRALPTTPSKVATVATPGTVGRADFVFGVRPAESQAPGSYYATVTFEALAPAV